MYLCGLAALIWGVPGMLVFAKGLAAYRTQDCADLWWLLMITACVLLFFFFIFRRIVDKYCRRIAALEGPLHVGHTFPLRGWILVVCMSSLGIVLRFFPFLPSEFTASFYCGLGPMLIFSAIRFLRFIPKL